MGMNEKVSIDEMIAYLAAHDDEFETLEEFLQDKVDRGLMLDDGKQLTAEEMMEYVYAEETPPRDRAGWELYYYSSISLDYELIREENEE